MSEKRSIVLLTLVTITTAATLFLSGCGSGDGDDQGNAAGSAPVATDPANEAGDDADEAGDNGDTGDNGDNSSSPATEVPDACSLVEAGEVEALIGAAEPEGESGVAIDMVAFSQCAWENDQGLFIVSVIEGPQRFESHVDNLPGEPLDGIGQEAITLGGVSSETRGATGGRTISALVDDTTLVVALKVEGQTTVEMVSPIATTIAGRLAS